MFTYRINATLPTLLISTVAGWHQTHTVMSMKITVSAHIYSYDDAEWLASCEDPTDG